MEAAESAVRQADTAASGAARVEAGQTGRLAQLQARADAAKATYERADGVYQSAVNSAPERVAPRSTAGENTVRFLEGVSSLLAGDRPGAERLAEEAGHARLAAGLEAETANEAARDEYHAAVGSARKAREAAWAAYQEASAAVRRAAAGAAGARTERVSASESHEVALSAERRAFVDASRITRIYEAVELDEVTRVLMAAALSAIVELEEETLGRVTEGAALQVIEAGLASYSEPRLVADARLASLEAKYLAAEEAASSAVTELDTAQASADRKADRKMADARPQLQRIESVYMRAVRASDARLDDALVRSFGFLRWRKASSHRREAARTYASAMEQTTRQRSRNLREAFPSLELPELAYPELPSLESVDADYVVSSVTTYRKARSTADARYSAAIVAALIRSTLTSDIAGLRAKVRSTAVARDSARSSYDAAFSVAQAARAFDEGTRGRLSVLEADVRAGLFAASRATP